MEQRRLRRVICQQELRDPHLAAGPHADADQKRERPCRRRQPGRLRVDRHDWLVTRDPKGQPGKSVAVHADVELGFQRDEASTLDADTAAGEWVSKDRLMTAIDRLARRFGSPAEVPKSLESAGERSGCAILGANDGGGEGLRDCHAAVVSSETAST